MHLLSLIGEQPIPNLLPIRFLQPDGNLLVYTETSRVVAERLRKMIPGSRDLGSDLFIKTPYDLVEVYQCLRQATAGSPDWVINFTGGTKIMSLAACLLAQEFGFRMVYLQSEGRASLLHCYRYQDGHWQEDSPSYLGPLITIEDYLNAHGQRIKRESGPANPQEAGLRHWLVNEVDECRTNLDFDGFEIDFMLRRGNQVAIVEAKDTKTTSRKGIDQLNTAGGRAYLGTYIAKLLWVLTPLSPNLSDLARERQIRVSQIDGKVDHRTKRFVLSPESQERLRQVLDEALCPMASK